MALILDCELRIGDVRIALYDTGRSTQPHIQSRDQTADGQTPFSRRTARAIIAREECDSSGGGRRDRAATGVWLPQRRAVCFQLCVFASEAASARTAASG